MKKALLAATCVAAMSAPAWAQTSTAVGTGVGVAKSSSKSQAVAISGQGGTGVGVGTGGNVTIAGTPANTHTVIENTGKTSVSTVPSVFAPGLAAAGLETCLGSVSVGASWLGTGLTGGGSIPDPGCAARLDARTLWSFGLKKAAVARLCLNPDIRASMPDVCGVYLPVAQPTYAPAILPTRFASANAEAEVQPYRGGPIMLVEGKTGRDRLCNDYDEPGQRCRVWDGVVAQHHPAKKKQKDAGTPTIAAVSTPIPAPAATENKKD